MIFLKLTFLHLLKLKSQIYMVVLKSLKETLHSLSDLTSSNIPPFTVGIEEPNVLPLLGVSNEVGAEGVSGNVNDAVDGRKPFSSPIARGAGGTLKAEDRFRLPQPLTRSSDVKEK